MAKLRESAKLLKAFRLGDKAALEEVYREYSDALFTMLKKGFAIESSGSRYLFEGFQEPWHLETAVQEIFTRAFSEGARNAYDGLRSYKNYLFTIARNYTVDIFRKKKFNFVPIDEISNQSLEGLTVQETPCPSPEESAAGKELQVLVEGFVASLSEDEQRLFEVRFTLGLSVEASAKRLGVTDYWVKRIEKKIKKRFFNHMKQRGYFEGYQYGAPKVDLPIMLILSSFTGGAWR
jgi:RNA polymerase sigma factor (sigma-70 family)